jgi:RNA polymerase sigma factor (sigma-70 family)
VASIHERAALKAVVEQYQQPLGSYLLHLIGDPDLALRVTEEAFVHAYRADAVREPGDVLHLWLYRVATLLAYRRLRPHTRTLSPAGRQSEHAVPIPQVYQPDERNQVEGVLRDLCPDERAVLLLSELLRLPHDEVALILGASPDQIAKLLAIARAHFRLAYVAHDALV